MFSAQNQFVFSSMLEQTLIDQFKTFSIQQSKLQTCMESDLHISTTDPEHEETVRCCQETVTSDCCDHDVYTVGVE